MIRVANAPVSYGAFELTVGILPNVPAADDVMKAVAVSGYEGIELGPLGYLGEGELLHDRLEQHGLQLAGAFVEIRFGEETPAALERTLDAIAGFGALSVLCDRGPRDGDVDLAAVQQAADLVRARGFEPTFHHHMGTRVQTQAEIERLLAGTDVGLLLDSGHLTAAGGDAVACLRDWRDRVNHVHLKDVRLAALEAPWDEAWRAGAFCELGTGDVDLEGFCRELAGYRGWLVVEQDWVPGPDDDPAPQIEAQTRNRRWLAEHARL